MHGNKLSQPIYKMKCEGTNIMVPTRDGTRLAVDVYRPDAKGRFPGLLAFAGHNKLLQTPEIIEACNNQPAWAPLWCGPAEGGDSKFFTARGYAHVLGNPRGFGRSDNGDPWVQGRMDAYDLIEWMAEQPWCDGNIGMVGISWFGMNQMLAAMTQPPHLKAIFPYDPTNVSFREKCPGGVMHSFRFHLAKFSAENDLDNFKLTPQDEILLKKARENPDYRMHPHVMNVLEREGKLAHRFFKDLIDCYEPEDQEPQNENLKKIQIPMYTGAGWYGYTYKVHLFGAFRYWANCTNTPFKKMLLNGPAHLPRPWTAFHDEILRWYDHWLKGIDTGIQEEPRVKIWVMGANRWRHSSEWPLKETRWTKLYLDSWERMRWEPFTPESQDGITAPDCFAQMPLTQTRTVQRLRYMTDPLPEDVEVTGPLSLHFWAAIDQEDTNWIIVLKDVGPDVSVQTAREGEETRPQVPEREITRGWMKGSHRALDEKKSLPGRPFHPFTRSAQKPVVPGEINRYDVEMAPTSNVFKKEHRICVDITSLDIPSGYAGDSAVEYIPYHICSSKTVLHKVYRCEQYPSHLLLPIIPDDGKS